MPRTRLVCRSCETDWTERPYSEIKAELMRLTPHIDWCCRSLLMEEALLGGITPLSGICERPVDLQSMPHAIQRCCSCLKQIGWFPEWMVSEGIIVCEPIECPDCLERRQKLMPATGRRRDAPGQLPLFTISPDGSLVPNYNADSTPRTPRERRRKRQSPKPIAGYAPESEPDLDVPF